MDEQDGLGFPGYMFKLVVVDPNAPRGLQNAAEYRRKCADAIEKALRDLGYRTALQACDEFYDTGFVQEPDLNGEENALCLFDDLTAWYTKQLTGQEDGVAR